MTNFIYKHFIVSINYFFGFIKRLLVFMKFKPNTMTYFIWSYIALKSLLQMQHSFFMDFIVYLIEPRFKIKAKTFFNKW